MFDLYMKKINKDVPFMWQRPKRNVKYTDPIWYDKVRVRHDPLKRFMKFLCKDANLSCLDYTNHSIRSTCLSKLDESGFEARHIIAVSGHKSESTIKKYAKKCPDTKKREMSSALGKAILPKKPKTATVSKPLSDVTNTAQEQNFNIKEDLPNFNLLPFDDDSSDTDLLNFLDNVDNHLQTVTSTDKTDNTVAVQNAIAPTQTVTTNTVTNNLNSNPSNFIPKMCFQNSTVTINYNFDK